MNTQQLIDLLDDNQAQAVVDWLNDYRKERIKNYAFLTHSYEKEIQDTLKLLAGKIANHLNARGKNA